LNQFIKLKDNDWVNKQRLSGKVVADALSLLEDEVNKKTTKSLIELNNFAEELILDRKCSATFKGYHGFPAAVCISVNNQLVHGVPTDYVLQDGDIVKFDLGATFQGVISDSALTCVFGNYKEEKHRQLVLATQDSLTNAIECIELANGYNRLGNIGYSIAESANQRGFGLISNYGGHGLDIDCPHAQPFVSNFSSTRDDGIRFQPGLTIAIEPLLCIGSNETTTSEQDKWTVTTPGINAHVEHTIYLHEDKVEVMTWRGERDFVNKEYKYRERRIL